MFVGFCAIIILSISVVTILFKDIISWKIFLPKVMMQNVFHQKNKLIFLRIFHNFISLKWELLTLSKGKHVSTNLGYTNETKTTLLLRMIIPTNILKLPPILPLFRWQLNAIRPTQAIKSITKVNIKDRTVSFSIKPLVIILYTFRVNTYFHFKYHLFIQCDGLFRCYTKYILYLTWPKQQK
jgi:hypothetical protein